MEIVARSWGSDSEDDSVSSVAAAVVAARTAVRMVDMETFMLGSWCGCCLLGEQRWRVQAYMVEVQRRRSVSFPADLE